MLVDKTIKFSFAEFAQKKSLVPSGEKLFCCRPQAWLPWCQLKTSNIVSCQECLKFLCYLNHEKCTLHQIILWDWLRTQVSHLSKKNNNPWFKLNLLSCFVCSHFGISYFTSPHPIVLAPSLPFPFTNLIWGKERWSIFTSTFLLWIVCQPMYQLTSRSPVGQRIRCHNLLVECWSSIDRGQ